MRPLRALVPAVSSVLAGGCLLLSAPSPDVPRLAGTRNILFVGNSHTYVNDLPQMVKTLAWSVGDTGLRVASITAPNFALEDHYGIGTVQETLRESSWRWVVLQQGTSALPESQINLKTWTAAFAPYIRDAGAEPVLYQIWPMNTRRFDAAAALTSYSNAAKAVDGILAPAGDAFTAALAADPPIDPYAPDGLHANREGTYLAALVLLDRILGIAPESLEPWIPGSTSDTTRVRALQAAARVALDRTPARPGQLVAASRQGEAVRVVHPDTTFFAEGLAADPRDGTLFITSVRQRDVLVVPAAGSVRWLLGPTATAATTGAASVGAVLGAVLDTARATLWLSTARLPHMAPRAGDDNVVAELLALSYPDGAIRRRWTLGAGDGIPGEIALAPDGTVLVSDGVHGLLYRLRRGAEALEVVRSPLLRSPQGIAVLPDGRSAYIADWSRGLLRWDLRTDSLVAVPTSDGRALRGVDGLRIHGGAFLAIQNGATPNRVLRVRLSDDGNHIVDLSVLDAPASLEGEMTVGVVVGGRFVYVASSEWPFWGERGERLAPTRALPPVTLRSLPLTP